MTYKSHTATYEYHRIKPNLWRVTCTCGAWHIATREECETWFVGHDLGDWIAEPQEPHWKRRLREIKS